jgi:hypothetical protein
MSNRNWVLSIVLMLALGASAQTTLPKPTPSQAAAPLKFQRLILKDGTYQLVSKYQRIGDRVRYTSAERGDTIEEVPASLVDFAATEKWAKEHVPGAPRNEKLAEAAAVDAEAAAERAELAARQPEVQPGLKLPDNDGVWGLDVYRGGPELFEVVQNAGAVNSSKAHNILKASINPLSGSKQTILLEGARAKVNFHVNDPALYIALDAGDLKTDKDGEGGAGVFTVDTQGGDSKAPKSGSPKSRYVIVRVEEKKTTRVVGALKVSMMGQVSQQQDVIDATTQVLPGGHWMKVTPNRPLEIGQYALVEMISPKEINLDVWDFGVNPQAIENARALTPVAAQTKRRPELR